MTSFGKHPSALLPADHEHQMSELGWQGADKRGHVVLKRLHEAVRRPCDEGGRSHRGILQLTILRSPSRP